MNALGFAVLIVTIGGTAVHAAEQDGTNPRVVMETSMGQMIVELFAEEAPQTVANFLEYVKAGTYDGTIFHRVIPDFMIQGGGFTSEMEQKPTRQPVRNESDNGLKNERGTLAMARTPDPHSATSQFFINSKTNAFLDHKGKNPQGWGYAVFGRAIEGMDVVDAISQVKTTSRGRMRDVPVTPVVIERVTPEE